MTTIEETTQKQGLCISCGLCAITCPEHAIVMHWERDLTWVPRIGATKCMDCGLCSQICPNTPECISEYATAAAKVGERFGLPETAKYFIAYDLNSENRIRSASGGALTATLMHLLESGEIDGVIASVPVPAPIGEPHHELRVMRSLEELDGARSSHYHPLCYDKVLREIKESTGRYALAGVPCVIRGIKHLPKKFQSKIRYTFSLVCSHNVTGQFLDCLAKQEGVLEGEAYTANQRDKFGGIPNAGNFNTYFRLRDREIRCNRFQTAWTDMWRNYFFAQECCLYCPDFYGADADMSVKDAWGRLSKDPLGISLLIVRNPELVATLEKLRGCGKLFLEQCDADEVYQSQVPTPIFKHIEVRDRLVWKPAIRLELLKKEYPLGVSRRWWKQSSLEYWGFRAMMSLSKFLYKRSGDVPVRKIVIVGKVITGMLVKKVLRRLISRLLTPARVAARFLGLKRPIHSRRFNSLRVLIAGGYGYGNPGDEAQVAADLEQWRNAVPDCRITMLTPNESTTERIHGAYGIRTEVAPRIVFFNANRKPYYNRSSRRFKCRFFLLTPLLLLNARLIRAGLPVFAIPASYARLLDVIYNSDVLFLAGGGYLTGMTLSRLWDNMLLIRLADAFGVPVILSGHTIGVFKDRLSRLLAKWGLKKAKLIYLRDGSASKKDLESIGIAGDKVECTFDDALFFQAAKTEEVFRVLTNNNIDIHRPYIVVNVQYWGQSSDVSRSAMKQLASAFDFIISEFDVQMAFLPMAQVDEAAIEEVVNLMQERAFVIRYDYDFKISVGVIKNASLCLTMKHHPIIFAMGQGTPTISVVLDDYYTHKNEGALRLFGQEEFLISCEPDELSQCVVEKFREAWCRRKEISMEIMKHVEELRPRAGEAIYRWLKEYNVHSGD